MNGNLNPERSEVYLTESDKFKERKRNIRCNRCKKLGHYARECRMPDDRGGMKKLFRNIKRKMKEELKIAKRVVKLVTQQQTAPRWRHSKEKVTKTKWRKMEVIPKEREKNKFKNPRLRIHNGDNDGESEKSNLLTEEVNSLTEKSRFAEPDSVCNRVVLVRLFLIWEQREKKWPARRWATLAIDGVGNAGIYNDVCYAKCQAKFGWSLECHEEGQNDLWHKGDVALKGKAINGLHAVDLSALLWTIRQQPNPPRKQPHKWYGKSLAWKMWSCTWTNNRWRGLVKGINLNNKYFRKRWNQKNKNRCVCQDEAHKKEL
jgi:hypothetical protein